MLETCPTYFSSSYVVLAADASTTSATYVTLLSVNHQIFATTDIVLIMFSGTGHVGSTNQMSSGIFIDADANPRVAGIIDTSGFSNSVALKYVVTGLSIGIHTIAVKYKSSSAGTSVAYQPVTVNPNLEHAHLLVLSSNT